MNRETMERLAGLAGPEMTPAYVFDLDILRSKVEEIREKLAGKAGLCFAMKANSFLVRPLFGLVDKYEVCSPGEFHICERLGVPMEWIVLSGVYKEEAEMCRVIEAYGGKGTYTIESRSHLDILQKCAKAARKKIKVLLRISSGNQFGVDPEAAEEIIRDRKSYPNLKFVGIQQYTGTQKKKFKKIAAELKALDQLLCRWKEKYGYEAKELEYGPGLFTPYFAGEEAESGLLEELAEALDKMEFSGRVMLEMGRYLAADCGFFFTKVVDQKQNLKENYAIVDGGIHHVNYYGQFMAMKQPHVTHIPRAAIRNAWGDEKGADRLRNLREEEPDADRPADGEGVETEWNICGSLCTSGDLLVKKMPLINLQIHDILVFEKVGAYSVTEAMYLFLSRNMPRVYFYFEKVGLNLVRRSIPTNFWNGEQV